MRLSFLALLSASVLFATSSCTAPSSALVRPIPVVVTDRPGCRIHQLCVTRSLDGWSVSGWLEGAWLRTSSRRGIEVEALDASGEKLGVQRTTARRYAQAPTKLGSDSARFEIEVPDSGAVARIRLSADPR